jgi:hypothetical protein
MLHLVNGSLHVAWYVPCPCPFTSLHTRSLPRLVLLQPYVLLESVLYSCILYAMIHVRARRTSYASWLAMACLPQLQQDHALFDQHAAVVCY